MLRLILVPLVILATAAEAKTYTTRRGGTATGSVVTRGTTATATGTATSASGKTVEGSASATYHPASDSVDASGKVTGPQGVTRSATATAGGGSATVTGSGGRSRTFMRR